jgi:hypothetical protein
MAKGNKGTRSTQKEEVRNTKLAEALVASGITSTVKIGNAIHNAEVISRDGTSILSNPMEYIDELSRYNPFWGNVALRVLCSAIGWYAVNSTLWDYRKRNQQPQYTSSIDWLNDSIATIKEKEQSQENFEQQGHSSLQFVDGHKFIGAYKYLFMLVTSSQDAGNFELPSPAVLYDRMRQKDKDRSEVLAAYDTFEMERFKDSPNYKYAKERLERNKIANDARAQKKAQAEIDHIHAELASVQMEKFDDAVWMQLPLWAQFKLIRSIHKQVIAAIANEMEKPVDERMHLDALNELGETVLLELEAADRTPEVRLAFDKGVLKIENHALITRT